MTLFELEDIRLDVFARQLSEADGTVSESQVRALARGLGLRITQGRIDAVEFVAECVKALKDRGERFPALWDGSYPPGHGPKEGA
jgi:hypothetical protein